MSLKRERRHNSLAPLVLFSFTLVTTRIAVVVVGYVLRSGSIKMAVNADFVEQVYQCVKMSETSKITKIGCLIDKQLLSGSVGKIIKISWHSLVWDQTIAILEHSDGLRDFNEF